MGQVMSGRRASAAGRWSLLAALGAVVSASVVACGVTPGAPEPVATTSAALNSCGAPGCGVRWTDCVKAPGLPGQTANVCAECGGKGQLPCDASGPVQGCQTGVPTTFGAVQTWANGPAWGGYTTLFGDVDGDHRADIVAINSSNITVAPSWGTTFGAPRTWSSSTFHGAYGTRLGDVDGDGRSDLVALDSGSVGVLLSSGAGFGTTTTDGDILFGAQTWMNATFTGSHGTLLGDVNGDQLADLVALNDGTITVALSTGNGFAAPTQWWGSPFYGSYGTLIGDIDGDGRADLVGLGNGYVGAVRSTGNGFGAYETWWNNSFYGAYGTFLGDVNGDGLADLVGLGGGYIGVIESTGKAGKSFGAYQTWWGNTFDGGRGNFLGDVDGDGNADLVTLTGTTAQVIAATGAAGATMGLLGGHCEPCGDAGEPACDGPLGPVCSPPPTATASLPAHPRLLVTPASIASAQALLTNDPTGTQQQLLQRVKTYVANNVTGQPLASCPSPCTSMQATARTVLTREVMLGALYLLHQDTPAGDDQAVAEMLNAATNFPTWYEGYGDALPLGEMTQAMALGYDWLYGYTSANPAYAGWQQKVASAIDTLGLKAGLAAYQPPQQWWAQSTCNWAFVVNGGLGSGALAVADVYPADAQSVLQTVRSNITGALAMYAPDGGWVEGEIYQGYATKYLTFLVAGLQTALGTDWGLPQTPGLSQTNLFEIYEYDPTVNATFNYADASPSPYAMSWHMLWAARQYDVPLYSGGLLSELAAEGGVSAQPKPPQAGDVDALGLLWWSPSCNTAPSDQNMPFDHLFRSANVATFRSSWTSTQATFVGFKGGDNSANHAHLDLGTFVYDTMGTRFVEDVLHEDYAQPNVFQTDPNSAANLAGGGQRWSYYRDDTEGHNTLDVSPAPGQKQYSFVNQLSTAKAPIIGFGSTQSFAFAIADLTEAYPSATSVHRGVALINRSQVLVQDEVSAPAGTEFIASLHTLASVTVTSPTTATLQRNGQTVYVQILTGNATFSKLDAQAPPSPNSPNPGLWDLTATVEMTSETSATLAMVMSTNVNPLPVVKPLSTW